MERTDFEQWKPKEVARLLALVETERRYYQEMVAVLPVPLAVVSNGKTIVWANRAFRRVLDLRAEDIRRNSLEQIVPIEGIQRWMQEVLIAQTASAQAFEATVAGHPVRVSAIPVHNGNDDVEQETLLILEPLGETSSSRVPSAVPTSPTSSVPAPAAKASIVPEQKAPEETLHPAQPPEDRPERTSSPPRRASPAATAVPLMDLPAIVWEADAATLKFNAVAGAAEELLGYAELHWIARPEFFLERIHPEDRASTIDLYRAVLETGGDASAEFRAISAGGTEIWCRETIRVAEPTQTPRTITGVITEVGNRKRLEQQLLSAGRAEALEAFAGRLAHDLNNPLMIANGFGEELLSGLGPGSPSYGDAQEIVNATRRVSEIALELTALTRRHANPPTRIYLDELMSGMERRFAKAAGDNVTLDMVPSDAPLWIDADSEQLALVLEAVTAGHPDAIAERTRVTVSWTSEHMRERIEPSPLAPGFYVAITVRDDGHGLEPAERDAIFDPVLVAGKSPEQGRVSRIPLSRAYHLVRQWGGDIGFDSQPFRGSSFTIFLPLLEPRKSNPSTSTVESSTSASPKPGVSIAPEPEPEPLRETILVVDDEAGIRGLMRKILTRERYVVVEAGTAEDALKAATAHGKPIDLLLTDVMLPGMRGPDLANQMVVAQPGLKVLYISGYTQDESVRAGGSPPGARFLPKPFTLGALLGKVRESLDG